MIEAQAQDIEVGPVRVDTGSNWLDFGMIIGLLLIYAVCAIAIKRWGNK